MLGSNRHAHIVGSATCYQAAGGADRTSVNGLIYKVRPAMHILTTDAPTTSRSRWTALSECRWIDAVRNKAMKASRESN